MSEALHCLHREPGWKAHPELTRWIPALEARFCILCLDWVRERDRHEFLRYVRGALAEGRTEEEMARGLEMDGIADPFAEPPRSYLNILLAKSKYAITDGRLKRIA